MRTNLLKESNANTVTIIVLNIFRTQVVRADLLKESNANALVDQVEINERFQG